MSARELGRLLGRSAYSVARARARYGRWDTGTERICRACDERPVWEESAKARRMGLCKACYLAEERRRMEEGPEADAVRSMRRRRRRDGLE